MTAVEDRPLARSLELLDRTKDWLVATIGPPPDGWMRADRVASDAEALEALRSGAVAITGPADPRTVGVMIMWRYADVASLATVLFRNDRRVPELDPAGVWFVPYTTQSPTRVALASTRFLCLPDDPDASHPDASPVPTVDDLRAALSARIEAFIEPVVAPMSAATHLGRKALWGIAASATLAGLAWSLAEAGDPDSGAAEMAALLAQAGHLASAPPSVEVIERDGRRCLTLTHGVCCRAYLYPGDGHDKCVTCPLRSREDRIAGQLALPGSKSKTDERVPPATESM
jgi:hypothetical protein